MPPYVTCMYVCYPRVTRVYPETIVRRFIRLKQTDRACWTIQTHSDEFNSARRRTFHGLIKLTKFCSSHKKIDVWPRPKPSRDD